MSFYKRKFMTPLTVEEKRNNLLTESFRQNKEFANKLKQRWNKPVDPILQRGVQYVEKPKTIQQCNLNYFQRMKQKETQIKPKSIHHNYGNAYKESSKLNNDKPVTIRKKIFTQDQIRPRRRSVQDQHIKIYPEQYSKSKIGYLIHNESTPFDDREKNNIRIEKKVYTPSEDYVKMNNKFKLLPSENRSNNNHALMGQRYTKEGFKSTKERLFNVGVSERPRSTPKMRLVHKVEVKEKTDHINDLISYQYAPRFREEKYTDKPNHSNFNTVVSHTIDNLNENFVTEPY